MSRHKIREPDMSWLRLPPTHEKVLLLAWTADSIVVSGRNLNAAHRLAARDLLTFMNSPDGGLSGEFRLTEMAKTYPPTGLKALTVRKAGRHAIKESS
jgi:hypothetical protein